jgi:hypothetical protein
MGGARQPAGLLWDKTYALWKELFEEATGAFGGNIIAAAEHLGVSKSFMFVTGRKLGADIFGKMPKKEGRPRAKVRRKINGVPRVPMVSLKAKRKADKAMEELTKIPSSEG